MKKLYRVAQFHFERYLTIHRENRHFFLVSYSVGLMEWGEFKTNKYRFLNFIIFLTNINNELYDYLLFKQLLMRYLQYILQFHPESVYHQFPALVNVLQHID